MELRIRPKSDYLHYANWEQIYALTYHWKSDIEFYKEEIDFFRYLIDKYFIYLIKDQNLSHLQSLTEKLSKEAEKYKKTTKKIDRHLHHLENLIEKSSSENDIKFREDHNIIEDQIVHLAKSFKILKKEIFDMTGQVIKEIKMNRLLS